MMTHGRPARRRSGHRPPGQDRWLVSYADFITLLFAFFTVMYAVSTVDARKVAPAASSMQAAFSLEPARRAQSLSVPILSSSANAIANDDGLARVRERIVTELADAIDLGRLEVVEDPRGLVLSLPVEATFAVGSADVHADARRLIGRIAATVRPLGTAVRIEGHTDDVPIRTARYASNWELSTARASAVVAFLIADAGIEPARLSAAGYGEFHPRAPNDTDANRARNRRVDIVVLNGPADRQEPGGSGASPEGS